MVFVKVLCSLVCKFRLLLGFLQYLYKNLRKASKNVPSNVRTTSHFPLSIINLIYFRKEQRRILVYSLVLLLVYQPFQPKQAQNLKYTLGIQRFHELHIKYLLLAASENFKISIKLIAREAVFWCGPPGFCWNIIYASVWANISAARLTNRPGVCSCRFRMQCLPENTHTLLLFDYIHTRENWMSTPPK
jgi:hypothetical protein